MPEDFLYLVKQSWSEGPNDGEKWGRKEAGALEEKYRGREELLPDEEKTGRVRVSPRKRAIGVEFSRLGKA